MKYILLFSLLSLAVEAKSLADYQAAAQQHQLIFELPRFESRPEQIQASLKQAIAESEAHLNRLVKQKKRSFQNTVAALDEAYYPAILAAYRFNLLQETSPDAELRDAARQASKELDAWFIKTSFRQDIYQAIKDYAATQPQLSGEDARLLQITLRDYRRNGMELSPEKRQKLQALKQELNELGIEYARHVNEADHYLYFSREDLQGLPADFFNKPSVKTKDGRYRINVNTTWQVIEVLRYAKKEAVRKQVVIARGQRAIESNIPIFKRMLNLRAQIAQLLGYAHWADYRIEPKMAQTAAKAQSFLQSLKTGLEPKFRQELATLAALKQAETGHAELHSWDIAYYITQLKKQKYQIDQQELKHYFELKRTLAGLFQIFEQLFQIRIEPIEVEQGWFADLQLYAVSDARSQAPLGLIYFDLFPRPGKYNHFAQFTIVPGKQLADGRYRRPVVALVGNFTPPSADQPSLLSYDQVSTLFHEFGHALHSVLTQARYAEFSGTSVPRDFVEAPSQMLENWVRDKSVLDRFAIDHRDGQSKIPQPVLDQLEAARLATIAIHYRRQLGFGLLDLALHSSTDPQYFDQVVPVSNRIMSETYLPVPENTALIAAFTHLAGGYDAGYYGYAWADAIAADMAEVFKQAPGGLMDQKIGLRLRDEIYAQGNRRDVNESIRAFLQREPSLEPFLRFIGL